MKNRRQYYEYIRETRLAGIPYSPQLSYKHKGWKSWRDWLGTERLPFAEARDVVRSLGLKEVKQYFEYAKNEGLPKGIPLRPDETYKDKGWDGWGDFLGNNKTRRKIGMSPPFSKARKLARSFGFGGQREYINCNNTHAFCIVRGRYNL